jgi:2-C-methyl-D-erythritol 4-phosphate cytidylyltransferase / 2-C-methyl-D-erythritol 2,4-cyclodiphosphate synthase
MSEIDQNIAIIVAAGNGSRAGGETPKQYRKVAGKPLLRHSYEAFLLHPAIDNIIIVVGAGQEGELNAALANLPRPVLVIGGPTRRESAYNGLMAAANIVPNSARHNVLIHDAARPFLSQQIISNLLSALNLHEAAVPALAIVDSLARGAQFIETTADRQDLWRIQTPQAFHLDVIMAAHQKWDNANEATDDARMAMTEGTQVALIAGDEALSKFTFASDFTNDNEAKSVQNDKMIKFRTGTGLDVHRLVAGEELWLCGVKIDHSHGLSGHSDADVALHAITDAMLGALALGDIGDHFPPSDAEWRGAASDQFALHALKLAADKGYTIGNVDVTIICETPKIGPYRMAMRVRLAHILSTDIENISVKATTTEQLGFTGRGEGIAAQAVVSFYQSGAI